MGDEIVIIFLPINLNICIVCSNELSHWLCTTYVLVEKKDIYFSITHTYLETCPYLNVNSIVK